MDFWAKNSGSEVLIRFFWTLFLSSLTPVFAELDLSRINDTVVDLSPDTRCIINCYQQCYQINQGNSINSCLCHVNSESCNYASQPLRNVQLPVTDPMEGFYEDAHVVVLNSKTFPDTFAFVLEGREFGESSWHYFNSSQHATLRFAVPNVCKRYEFRISLLLAENETILTFPPSSLSSSPPDFVIENVQLIDLTFDKDAGQVVAEYFWKHPWGYKEQDVNSYSAYVHPTICSVPEGLGVLPQPESTVEGGRLQIRFPEIMAQAKCRFLIHIEGTSVCGQRILDPTQAFLQLDCHNIKNYPCGTRTRPYCLNSRKDTIILTPNTGSRSEGINATLRWSEPPYQKPLYYHVRFGNAQQHDIFGLPGLPPPNPGGQNFPGPVFDSFGGIYQLGTDAKNLKINGNETFTNLSNVAMNSVLGLQICAIYNAEYKLPNFKMLEVLPYRCVCASSRHTQSSCRDVICGRNGDLPDSQTTSSDFFTNPATPPSVEQNLSVQNFSQTFLGNSDRGSQLKISWVPPENAEVHRYRVFLKTESQCTGAKAPCCDFAQFNPMTVSDAQVAEAILTLPPRIQKLKCKFVLKVETEFSNGIVFTSMYSLRDLNSNDTVTPNVVQSNPIGGTLLAVTPVTDNGDIKMDGGADSGVDFSQNDDTEQTTNQAYGQTTIIYLETTITQTAMSGITKSIETSSPPTTKHPKYQCVSKSDLIIDSSKSMHEVRWSGSPLASSTYYDVWLIRWGPVANNRFHGRNIRTATQILHVQTFPVPPADFGANYGIQICAVNSDETQNAISLIPKKSELAEIMMLKTTDSSKIEVNFKDRTTRPVSGKTGLPPDVALALKIVIPISLLLILLGLLSIFCFYRWRQIKEFWVKRRGSTYRPRDWQVRHPPPAAIDLQEAGNCLNGTVGGVPPRKVSCTSLTGQNGQAPKGITSEPGQQRTFVRKMDI